MLLKIMPKSEEDDHGVARRTILIIFRVRRTDESVEDRISTAAVEGSLTTWVRSPQVPSPRTIFVEGNA